MTISLLSIDPNEQAPLILVLEELPLKKFIIMIFLIIKHFLFKFKPKMIGINLWIDSIEIYIKTSYDI